jgi:hypothetical protein
MSQIIIEESGKVRDVEDVELAEKIIEKRRTGDPWDVIDALVQVWAKKAPDEAEAVMINVDQYKESLVDKKFGLTKMGGDHDRRFKLAFPITLELLIRTQYKADELPFDNAFHLKFAQRYPAFRVAEKD